MREKVRVRGGVRADIYIQICKIYIYFFFQLANLRRGVSMILSSLV